MYCDVPDSAYCGYRAMAATSLQGCAVVAECALSMPMPQDPVRMCVMRWPTRWHSRAGLGLWKDFT